MQNRLDKHSKGIKVTSNLNIDLSEYQKYFKYKIYECFKPMDLKQTRNYLEYLTTEDPDSNTNTVNEEDLSPELYNYLSKDMQTKLPNYIN